MITNERLHSFIKVLVEKIRHEYQPDKIILYGSYAYGEPDKDSDIDLLIIKDTPEKAIQRRVRVRQIVDIRDADLPAFCPLVITPQELRTRLEYGDQFLEKIVTHGVLLYGD